MSGAGAVAQLSSIFGDRVEYGEGTVVVEIAVLAQVLSYLRREVEPPYDVFVDLIAVDHLELQRAERFVVQYCLRSSQNGSFLRIEVSFNGPSLPSATALWSAADWFEREVYDLLGIGFDGHADLRRIFLPLDFVDHPLRKDYPLAGIGEREKSRVKSTFAPSAVEPYSEEGEIAVLDFVPLYAGQGLRLALAVEGEHVRQADPDPGYVHTGLEKLAESLTYGQCVHLAGRLGEESALGGELAMVLAIERLLGMEVPARAGYLRVIWSELGRLSSHLAWLGEQARLAGSPAAWHRAWAERDKLKALWDAAGKGEEGSLVCIGGAVVDMEPAFAAAATEFCAGTAEFLDEIDQLFTGHPVWLRRVRGLGGLSVAEAFEWGVSGPVLRAAGIARDLRRDEPYSQYEDFEFEVPVGEYGDVYDRCQVRLAEIAASVRIVAEACAGLPAGDHRLRDRRLMGGDVNTPEGLVHHFATWMDGHGLQPLPGEVYLSVEAPRGELGIYLVSDGTGRPYRLRFRTPSFVHLQCYPHLVCGLDLEEAALVLGSLNISVAEVDR